MAIEILLYGITALITINGLAVLIATWIALKNGQIDEYKRQYWRVMLENAQRAMDKQDKEKNENKSTN